MPPAAKGGNPLWKPSLGVWLLRVCVSFSFSEALDGMDKCKVEAFQDLFLKACRPRKVISFRGRHAFKYLGAL